MNKINLIVTHPTGNANVRAVIAAFLKEEMLLKYNTTIAINLQNNILKFLPETLRHELLRRTFPISLKQINTFPALEITRLILPKLGLSKFTQGEHSFAGIDNVYRNFDKKVAKHLLLSSYKNKINGVYAYEDGALETFKQAKKIGVKCIYDLPIAYWETSRSLLQKESERLPKWSHTLGGGINDSEAKLERKTQELELSDMIIGPSKFVINSLPQWSKNKIQVLSPFGSPTGSTLNKIYEKTIVKEVPLRVLFVGSMGQRKGLGDLFTAVKMLNTSKVELVIMGSLLAPMEFYRSEFSGFTYEHGRPHSQVLELMKTCDIFCLPSIIEGRALVIQEAMSQGLPVIITPNTGGEDLVIEGETGFLVPIASPDKIAEKINWFLENRSRIEYMGNKAQELSSSYTWEKYGSKIVESISYLLKP